MLNPEKKEDVEHRTVVSLKTETYRRGDNFVTSKVVRTLKRKSKGFDILSEGVSEYLEDLNGISGIYTLPDGEYELKYDNPSQDWETGVWDFDGYKLVAL